jgi:hypothetical protein
MLVRMEFINAETGDGKELPQPVSAQEARAFVELAMLGRGFLDDYDGEVTDVQWLYLDTKVPRIQVIVSPFVPEEGDNYTPFRNKLRPRASEGK